MPARNEIFDEGYMAIKSGFTKLSRIMVEIDTSGGHVARVRLLDSPFSEYLRSWVDVKPDSDSLQHCPNCAKGDISKLVDAYPFYQASFYFDWPIHQLPKH
jgi:hypothetical protein